MNIDLSQIKRGKRVAVAVSGGSDSMALLHFLSNNSDKLNIKVLALNVEHGIRGKQSKKDSYFVENYCKKNNIPLISYSVDSIGNSKAKKISIEHSARELRYNCFYQALNDNKCDCIATAHHLRDNSESVLINLFRGTGIKGLTGINDYGDKIIRPLIKTTKEEIEYYIKRNKIPFVTDKTNFDDELTRNFVRHKILPKIKEVFPDVENSLYRLASIAKIDDDFIESEGKKKLNLFEKKAEIKLPVERAVFSRACISALKHVGLTRDWEKIHIDEIFELTEKENGKKINLPKNIVAYKEYNKIVIEKKKTQKIIKQLPFSQGEFNFNNTKIKIEKTKGKVDLLKGFYLDLDKIPKGAVIRNRKEKDTFTKFGGGTKSLGDYLTNKKIPLRERDSLVLIAKENEVYAIFGVAVSDKTKIDKNSKNIIKITKE
ncbi:MAG: tRNA lysidine(34) synthetase TilS [Clostridia bacterium]|nr:tRNA lysidine(34) synthetase TilS [Clostridia bacterium]